MVQLVESQFFNHIRRGAIWTTFGVCMDAGYHRTWCLVWIGDYRNMIPSRGPRSIY
jgi:hypothetical protein